MLLGNPSIVLPPWSEDGEFGFNGICVDTSVSGIFSEAVIDSFMSIRSIEDGV